MSFDRLRASEEFLLSNNSNAVQRIEKRNEFERGLNKGEWRKKP